MSMISFSFEFYNALGKIGDALERLAKAAEVRNALEAQQQASERVDGHWGEVPKVSIPPAVGVALLCLLLGAGSVQAAGYEPEVFCQWAAGKTEPHNPRFYPICMAQERNALARFMQVIKKGWVSKAEYESCRLRIDRPDAQWGLVAMEGCIMQAAQMRYNGLTQ